LCDGLMLLKVFVDWMDTTDTYAKCINNLPIQIV